MKAVIYARYSSSSQREESIEGQIRECMAYAERNGYMVIGTSALTKCELDSVVNVYAGCWNNPFAVWSKYRKGWFRTTLSLSFQFHHTQMDGPISTGFLNRLQEVMNNIEY